MTTFLLIFKGFAPSAVEQAEYEETWHEWIEEIKRIGTLKEAGLLAAGTLMIPNQEGRTLPLAPSPENSTGFMVLEAENEDAVVSISKKCPTCEISGVVEIYPLN
ncbi:MAG: YciI family protein [Candidatus Andersenbacteria bacterium]